jgi:hypothetical protein
MTALTSKIPPCRAFKHCLRRDFYRRLVLFPVAIAGALHSASALAQECRQMTSATFAKQSESWRGRTLIASASWCSSCKSKLLEAQKKPDDFVILVAFDEATAMEQVLKKFAVTSPCIAGEDLVKDLKISALPWHAKI